MIAKGVCCIFYIQVKCSSSRILSQRGEKLTSLKNTHSALSRILPAQYRTTRTCQNKDWILLQSLTLRLHYLPDLERPFRAPPFSAARSMSRVSCAVKSPSKQWRNEILVTNIERCSRPRLWTSGLEFIQHLLEDRTKRQTFVIRLTSIPAVGADSSGELRYFCYLVEVFPDIGSTWLHFLLRISVLTH